MFNAGECHGRDDEESAEADEDPVGQPAAAEDLLHSGSAGLDEREAGRAGGDVRRPAGDVPATAGSPRGLPRLLPAGPGPSGGGAVGRREDGHLRSAHPGKETFKNAQFYYTSLCSTGAQDKVTVTRVYSFLASQIDIFGEASLQISIAS